MIWTRRLGAPLIPRAAVDAAPLTMTQGLEEMKETAREINEAVALGKETEAGINEVRASRRAG